MIFTYTISNSLFIFPLDTKNNTQNKSCVVFDQIKFVVKEDQVVSMMHAIVDLLLRKCTFQSHACMCVYTYV